MALHCGIIGIANCGKTTVFNCMSNSKAETSNFAFTSNKSNIGVINVPDARLKELEKFQKTEKIIAATVDIVDIPGLTKGSSSGEGVGNQFLADIRNADAIIHVLRCFENENLPHIEGSVNPVRDIETIDLELQVKDLESITKKIARLEKLVKIGDKEAKASIEVLKIYQDHLENMQNARTAPVNDEDRKHVADLSLLSEKPVMFVCNIDEASISKGNKHVENVKAYLKDQDVKILTVAAELESEISELETDEERAEFLADYGLSEPSVNKIIREAYDLLNLQSFFTVGQKEIRAWTIKKGMTAPEAAGVIHSDLQRGFIRAEVMKYEDFTSLGSEQAVKNAGKFHVEGKNYIVEDGDILHIRFNV
ncbi:MAG: redox-regulated ATPase YchF [Bacteroidales bacterium]|nr:redox-regulated ATPase YchF [Bacteroidales bacterium]MCK9498688.1 redox-regulated ATPase YchF [Bacteroidales bacterium]MDY0314018.1 redox-regulated ATPase YchF [Bacteroidales bacterium]NLB86523.1 redox-regulated ATPase YchF [Bacteroidales bacterium]